MKRKYKIGIAICTLLGLSMITASCLNNYSFINKEHNIEKQVSKDTNKNKLHFLDELLEDNATEYDYSVLNTIELKTFIDIDPKSNRKDLERVVIENIFIEKEKYNIPINAKIKITNFDIFQATSINQTIYYCWIEIEQSHYYTSSKNVIENINHYKRNIHIIPNWLDETIQTAAAHNNIDFTMYLGPFGCLSDGDIYSQISFYQNALCQLVSQNINTFFLNPPKTLEVNDIFISNLENDIDGKTYLNISIYHYIKNNKIIPSFIESKSKVTLSRYSLKFKHNEKYEDIYSFDIGAGDYYEDSISKIKKFLSNPINIISSNGNKFSTVPISSEMTWCTLHHIEDDEVYYVIKYNKLFGKSFVSNNLEIKYQPQNLLVKILGFKFKSDINTHKFENMIKNVKLSTEYLENETSIFFKDEKIVSRCSIYDDIEAVTIFNWYYYDGFKYKSFIRNVINNVCYIPTNKLFSNSTIKVEIYYMGSTYSFISKPIVILDGTRDSYFKLGNTSTSLSSKDNLFNPLYSKNCHKKKASHSLNSIFESQETIREFESKPDVKIVEHILATESPICPKYYEPIKHQFAITNKIDNVPNKVEPQKINNYNALYALIPIGAIVIFTLVFIYFLKRKKH